MIVMLQVLLVFFAGMNNFFMVFAELELELDLLVKVWRVVSFLIGFLLILLLSSPKLELLESNRSTSYS